MCAGTRILTWVGKVHLLKPTCPPCANARSRSHVCPVPFCLVGKTHLEDGGVATLCCGIPCIWSFSAEGTKGKYYQSLATSEQSPKREFSPKISLKPGAELPKLEHRGFHKLTESYRDINLCFSYREPVPERACYPSSAPCHAYIEIYEDPQPLQLVEEGPTTALGRI